MSKQTDLINIPDAITVSATGVDVTGTVTSDGLTVDGSSTLDDIKLTSVALPSSGNPSIALRNTDNNIYIQTGSGNALSLLDSSQNSMYTVSSTSHSFNISNTERARIISQGAFQASTNGSFRTWAGNILGHQMNTDQQSQVCFTADAENSGYTSDVIRSLCNRGASSSWKFLTCTSGNLGDDEFLLRGDGQAYADGSWNGGGADYAEYFETTTGNAIPRGTTVVLDNNKVRAATSDDLASSIIGVIRPKEDGQISAMVGNTGWSKWSEKYLTDDFGVYLMDDHNVIEFDGKTYESHKVPEDVTIPDDAVTTTHDGNGLKFQHRRENPDYDSSLTYSPREDRDEWVIVGLLGQVRILGGQPTGDRWIKMRDISETVEEWFIR